MVIEIRSPPWSIEVVVEIRSSPWSIEVVIEIRSPPWSIEVVVEIAGDLDYFIIELQARDKHQVNT